VNHKETVSFAVAIIQAIQRGDLKANFKGVALGDSWISPIDFLLAYPQYLFYTSEVDYNGMTKINQSSFAALKAVNDQQWTLASNLWASNQGVIMDATDGINFYNILDRNPDSIESKKSGNFSRHLKVYEADPLDALMNGKIRDKLKIIPQNVTWGGQSGMVFQYMETAFMKPYISQVDFLLQQGYQVTVYSGNLDLICCTTGTLAWMNKLKWPDYEKFSMSERKPLRTNDLVVGFQKQYKNLRFFVILGAGHMVPSDQPEAAKALLDTVLTN